MTKKEDVREALESRKAALLAVHLVSQILDEANVIANAAEESGQPWRYLSTLRNMRSGKLGDVDEDGSFITTICDSDGATDNNEEQRAKILATSTPEKLIEKNTEQKNETSMIGQGDEDSIAWKSDRSKSTSMFINHLFDMSDVENLVVCDCDDVQVLDSTPNSLITQAISKIMESYINMAFKLASVTEAPAVEPNVVEKTSNSSDNSCYSFLADAFVSDVKGDIAFYIDEDGATANVNLEVKANVDEVVKIIEITEETEIAGGDYEIEKNMIDFCESAYLTLNRDYEQYSEEEAEVLPEDPKTMSFQEVKLIDDSISESTAQEENIKQKDDANTLAATSAVSGASGSRRSKSSVMSRCRSHGARLLACLRGWWRRKTPGQRKECRPHGLNRGMCPLSPAARRRASSLLDNRNLYSPTSQRTVMWKYNTLNEAVVNSPRWKDYAFDMKPDECEEIQTLV